MAEQISLSMLGAWFRRQPDEMQAVSHAACLAAAQGSRGVVARTIRETTPYPPVDTGAYRAGWTATPETYGAALSNAIDYAGAIEVGTGPHLVPYQTLLEWAERKLRGARPSVSSRRSSTKATGSRARTSMRVTGAGGGSGQSLGAKARPKRRPRGKIDPGDTEGRQAYIKYWSEVEALAHRAQNAIAKKGTAPRNILLRSKSGMERIFAIEIRRAMDRYAKAEGREGRKLTNRTISTTSTTEDE